MNKNCGIYKITSPTGRIYIGQSVDIKRRFRGYSTPSLLKKQPRLQNSFSKYGVENHQFDIIEYCSEEDLNCSERFWQDEFIATGENGLNCSLTKCGSKRYTHSEETKRKISESSMGDKNPMYGKKMSEEAKEKRNNNPNGKSKKGIPLREETKEKLKGKRENISLGKHPKAKKVIDIITKKVYGCITEAAEAHGIERRTLSDWLKKEYNDKTTLRYF